MESPEFKDFAMEMVDYIVKYMETIRERRVVPDVKPGYLRPLVPEQAPDKPEPWTAVMADLERVIMPGVTHWESPNFYAYFASANSYPAIVADMLSDAIACLGLSWIASPACTELEVVMLDWLGQMLGLPDVFLARSGGKGGGVIQGSASEATLVALLGAKSRMLHKVKQEHPEWTENEILPKLVGYISEEAHSSVERAGMLGGVTLRKLRSDERRRLRGDTLRDAIRGDLEKGFIPFYVVATLGTTSSCAFDALEEIGPVCNEADVWLHIDAAYAGSAFICPEFRYLMAGVEHADSFNFNPHKWLLVSFDCSVHWLKDPGWIINIFNLGPLEVKHEQHNDAPDYRQWRIPLSNRFRALKLWFVLRLYGVENLQAYIRKHVAQAHLFEDLCRADERFEIVEEVIMGLVCFRLKASNETNENLLRKINARGKIYLVPSKTQNTFFLRMAICSRYSEKYDIEYCWDEIKSAAEETLRENKQ